MVSRGARFIKFPGFLDLKTQTWAKGLQNPHRGFDSRRRSPGVVTAFDTETLAELETIDTEPGAHTIGWDPATKQLYVFALQRGGALVFKEVG